MCCRTGRLAAGGGRGFAALYSGLGLVDETLKWAQPVYSSNGPVCLIKATKGHVAFGLWRGARLLDLDRRLERAGGFEMALIKLKQPGEIAAAEVQRLVA